MAEVSISPGNSKMGHIPSVSFPSRATCRDCDCWIKCYAAKIERLRRSVREAYRRNLAIYQNDPEEFWAEVESVICTSRFFRFHVSGDIPDDGYFARMVQLAARYPHCEMLCFTKKYELVNRYLDHSDAELPANLHLIFSGWKNLKMVNPYHLPEAHVLFRDGSTTARTDAKACGGNCTDCARTDSGCWTLKRGEQVVFHEH